MRWATRSSSFSHSRRVLPITPAARATADGGATLDALDGLHRLARSPLEVVVNVGSAVVVDDAKRAEEGFAEEDARMLRSAERAAPRDTVVVIAVTVVAIVAVVRVVVAVVAVLVVGVRRRRRYGRCVVGAAASAREVVVGGGRHRAVAAAAAAAARGLCADRAMRVVLAEPLVRLGRAARARAGGVESVRRAVVGGAVCAAAVVVLLGALDGDGLLVDVAVDAARRARRPRGGGGLRSASDGGGGGDDGGRWRWSA